jgi:hypothetical protein
MHDRLRNQHPVKRIRVNPWQPARMERGFLIYIQRLDAARITDRRYKKIRSPRKRKEPGVVF